MRRWFEQINHLITALAAASLLAGCSGVDEEGTPRRIARQVDQALTTVAENELATDPERASRLGLTEAAVGYGFSRRLTDRSQGAYERKRLTRLETLEGLLRTPRPAAGGAQARHLDTLIAAYESAEPLFLAGHGATGLGEAYPYVADHLRGAYIDVPILLTRFHPIRSQKDADAFEDRLRQWAGAIDDDRRRLMADGAAGITPPTIVLERMVKLTSAARNVPPDASPVITALDSALETRPELSPEARASRLETATRIYSESVLPALATFEESLIRLAQAAPDGPGVWRLPQGERFYSALLEALTGLPIDPASLHARALADVATLTRELDAALTTIGLVDGSVMRRLQTLALEPGQVYPATPEGEAALIARLQVHLQNSRTRLATLFIAPPDAPVELRRLAPGALDAGAIAAYRPAPADQSAPAILAIDPTRQYDWPDFTLATLVARETLPGRHLASVLAAELGQLPLARQILANPGFTEGWAGYSETLADEAGLHAVDPASRIGYLRSRLIRATEVVAETGLHHQRWTRLQAITYLSNTTGLNTAAATEVIDRLSVSPGGAAAGWLGRTQFLDMRETSMRVLGPKFDIRAFHAVLLNGGPRPLQIVEDDVKRWYTDQID